MDIRNGRTPYLDHAVTTEYISGGQDISLLEKPLAATALAITHGVNSLVNSAFSIGHIGLNEQEEKEFDKRYKTDTKDVVANLYGKSWQNFYARNETGINLAGEFAATLVPGTAAMKIMQGARALNFGKYYKLLDATGKRDEYLKLATTAEKNFGEYAQTFNALRKAQFAGAVAGVQEAAAVSALSAVMLNDSRMYEDYSLRTFFFEAGFGGAVLAPFRYFGAAKQVKNSIKDFEKTYIANNAFMPAIDSLAPDENLVNMITERAGRAFTDPQQQTRFENALLEQVEKFASDTLDPQQVSRALMPAVQSMLRTNPADAVQKSSELFAGLKKFSAVLPGDETITQGAPEIVKGQATGKQLYSAYLDRFTGEMAGQAVRGAADSGYTVQGLTRIVDPKGKQIFAGDAAKAFVANAGKGVRPEEADALHQIFTQAGKSVTMQKDLLGKDMLIDADNMFHLELAIESGQTWKTTAGLDLTVENARLALREKKMELLDKFYAGGTEFKNPDSLRMLLNSQLDLPTVGLEANALSGLKPGQLAPRLLKMEYAVERDALSKAQATLMENVFNQQKQQRIGMQLQSLGIEPLSLRAKELTSVDPRSSLVGFAGQAEYGSAQNIFEAMGSRVAKAATDLRSKWGNKLRTTAAPFLRDGVDLGEFNIVAREIQSQPAKLVLVDLPDGKAYLLDSETGVRATGSLTGQELPDISNPTTLAFLRDLRDGVGAEFRSLYNARVKATGRGKELDPQMIYVPPTAGRFVGLAKFKNGVGKGIVRGQSEEDYAMRKAAFLKSHPDAEVLDTPAVRQKLMRDGLFDDDLSFFDNIEASIEVQRTGTGAELLLGNDTRMVDSVVDFYEKAANAHVRNLVKDYYEQDLAMLSQLQSRFSQVAESKFGKVDTLYQQQIEKNQPFFDSINTLLNISNARDIPIFDNLNKAVTASATRAHEIWTNTFKGTRGAAALQFGEKSFEQTGKELNEISKQYGLNQDFTKVTEQLALTRRYSPQFASSVVATQNAFFATAQLGIDIANTMVNLISFGVGAIPEVMAMQRKIAAGELRDVMGSLAIPKSQSSIFTPLRAMQQVAKELAPGGDKTALKRWVDKGVLPSDSMEYFNLADEYMRSVGSGNPTKLGKAWNGVAEFVGKGVRPTRNWLVEKPNAYLRYASVRTVELLLKGQVRDDVLDTIASQFVKRVQHNFPSGQRPILFQGPVGAAITLYQTYFFNTVQNLARYAGEGDTRALSAFFAAQSTAFGLQSNPVFQTLNSGIAYRDGNPNRQDLYADFQHMDWALYGPVSATLGVNLYSRGDLTPRNMLIIPSAVQDIPAVGQSARLYGALWSGTKRIADAVGDADFARIGGIMSQTAQESGFSRPLAGIAALVSGEVVDAQGSKVSETSFSFADAMRVTGARPFEEAKLLDLQRRFIGNKLEDRELVEKHGKTIKEKIRAGVEFTGADLGEALSGYIAAGGNENNFQNWLKLETEKANVPLAQRLANKYKNDPDMKPWLEFLNERSRGLD